MVLSDPDKEEPRAPQLAVDAAGNAVAVWSTLHDDHGGVVIRTASRPAGGEWSEPEPIGPNEILFPGIGPHLAMNAAGDAIAVWTRQDQAVKAAVLPAGGEWGESENVAGGQAGWDPQVGIDAAGNAIAVWQLPSPANSVIRTASLPAGGEWSGPEDLSDLDDDASAPQVAVSAAGNAVAAWLAEHEGPDSSIEAAVLPAGGEWSESEPVSDADLQSSSPEAAIDADGAVVTWRAAVGVDDRIMRAAVRPTGAAEWSMPENVSAPVDEFRSSDLETNAAAGAIAIWTRFDGTGNNVQASVRPPGGVWSDPEDLSSEGREAGLADLAFDPAGDAIALWGTAVEDGFVAQATGYDFIAPRLDDVVIPAGATVGEPVGFSVSPFDVFPLGATTWSFGDGGTAAGNAVSHVYTKAGAYPVTVSVVDLGGNTSTQTAAIAITEATTEATTSTPPPPRPDRRLTTLSLRIKKKSLPRLRRSGKLAVTAAVDSVADAVLSGRVKLRVRGKARTRLVPIFVPQTVHFAGEGEQTVRLTLTKRGRKVLRPLSKARIRIEGEASDPAGATALDSTARTLRG